MKLPLSWMRDFVSVDAPVEEISRRLSYAGLVVEHVEKLTPGFAGVFAARVLNVEKHPNADRLNLVERRRRRKRKIQSRVRRAQRQGRHDRAARSGWRAARQGTAAGGSRHSRRAVGGHAVLGARARPVAGSRGNSRARRRRSARRRRGRVFAPRRDRARRRNHAESRRLPVDSRPRARGRGVVRRTVARAASARGAFGRLARRRTAFDFGFDRRARSLPALRRARDDRNQDRPFAGVAQAPAGTVRDARAQQRRRCDQLRHARTRPALARVRLRQNRRAAR